MTSRSGRGELHAERSGDLIAHAGIAIFEMVAVAGPGAPQLVQLAGKAAGRSDDDGVIRGGSPNRADHLGVGWQRFIPWRGGLVP